MKSPQFSFGLAAATALLALAFGAANAQTPTNGNPVHPSPATGGPTPAGEPSPNGGVGTAARGTAAGGFAEDQTPSQNGIAQGNISRDATQAFVTQAAQANRAEIEEGKYMMDHTKSSAVKQFAQRMIHDHTRALDQLKQVASTDGYTVPSSIDTQDKESMDSLEHDRGARANMAYSSDQEKDHRETIARFEQAAQNRQIAPAVRDYARMTLPVLKEHLRLAQQLVASESKGNHKTG